MREPEVFASGDSLIFQRYLPNYLPSDGWSIAGVLSQNSDAGALPKANFESATDPTGRLHLVNVPNFGAGLDSGAYIFSEEIVNAGTGERHQIYYADNFMLGPNLAAGLATGSQQTMAQQMVGILFTSLKQLYVQQFQETDVQRNRFVMQKQQEVRKELQYWLAMRQNEVQHERARNGQPSGAVAEPIFMIG